MAQDETYQTTVYMEREGNRVVAGSGGTFVIESGGSMTFADSTTINLIAGAAFSMESGAILGLLGTDVNATDMRKVLASEWGAAVEIGTGTTLATESLFVPNNLPKNVRIVNLLAAVSASLASFYLTSVSAGREVFIRLVGDSTGAFTNNETYTSLNCSGCILLNSIGGVINTLHLWASTNSNHTVHLIAPFDDVWAVVNETPSATITES